MAQISRYKWAILNTMILAIFFCGWYQGLFSAFTALSNAEYILLAAISIYSLIGFIACFMHKWHVVQHVANGIPMWALAATGLGMSLAVMQVGNVGDVSLSSLFKTIALSIVPNILGITLMAWLRELAFWCGNEEI